MKTIELSRKQLYNLVWSTPITKLTLQYVISVEGLKKLCKQFDIPMPPNGYWLKLKYNKPFIKKELNTVFDGEDKIPLTIREEGNPINLDQTPLAIKTIEIKNDPKAPLTVSDKLTKPDILIQKTKDLYSKIKKEPYTKKENIDSLGIYVENDNLDRAFRIMDTFIKVLRHRGHTFRRDINNRGSHIAVNDVDFYFHLREAQTRSPATTEYFSSTYAPTGILMMKIGSK